MNIKYLNKKLSLMLVCSTFFASNANAETIFEAMSDAYNTNPTLQGERANSGATNENSALARSGFRPTVGLNGTYKDTHTKVTGTNTVDSYTKGGEGQVTQSIFSGFQTYNSVKSADSAAKAEIQNLYAVEQEVLLSAATAYLDVLQSEAIVRLQQDNERLLKKELDETLARFDVGEVTKTDVAQSRASYAQAQANRVLAEGNLAINKAIYVQIVGKEPKDLAIPEHLQKLFPKKFEEAMEYAKTNNYSYLAAQKSLDAADYNVKSQTGALLPEVTFNATTGKYTTEKANINNPTSRSSEYTLNMAVPLYAGGATRAKIRQSKYQKWQAEEGLLNAERAVVSSVTGNWESMQTSKTNIASIKEKVKASAIALEGTRKEEALGNRTVLDVLDAYQTLLQAQVSEVTARHNYYVSGLQLLQSMGKLTAKSLALKVNYYNAEANYQNTKGKWLSLSIDK